MDGSKLHANCVGSVWVVVTSDSSVKVASSNMLGVVAGMASAAVLLFMTYLWLFAMVWLGVPNACARATTAPRTCAYVMQRYWE